MTIDAENDLDTKDTSRLVHCVRCGIPLVPPQEIAQAADLLAQAGMGEMIAEERRDLLQTCTGCKSFHSIHSFRNIKLKPV